MFRMNWKTSQGGDFDYDEGNNGDVELPEHPLHDAWRIICGKVKKPAEYTTAELLEWINTTVDLFGFDTFKTMMKSLDS
jgi:hypothetical protein